VPPDSVRCTRDRTSELATFGFLVSCSAIIHRTVRCSTGLSGAQSGATTTAPTVVCKSEQCVSSSRRVKVAPEGAPDSEQCLSGAPRCQSSNDRNRQNPNSWVTWLAHRTPTAVLVVGAINIPQPPLFKASKFFRHLTHYKS
jgi:transcriptional regulator GlxA family with amidase domain